MTTSETLKSNVIQAYTDIHLYGKIVSAGIFVTHGIIDYATTAIARQIAIDRGIAFAKIESNPVIAGTRTGEMAVVILIPAFIVGLSHITLHHMNNRIGNNNSVLRLIIDGIFTLFLIGGIYINFTNLLFLLNI